MIQIELVDGSEAGIVGRLTSDYETGELAGVALYHRKPDGSPCAVYAGWVRGANRRPVDEPLWTLVSLDPLTLSPSVVCRACGWHVVVAGGRY